MLNYMDLRHRYRGGFNDKALHSTLDPHLEPPVLPSPTAYNPRGSARTSSLSAASTGESIGQRKSFPQTRGIPAASLSGSKRRWGSLYGLLSACCAERAPWHFFLQRHLSLKEMLPCLPGWLGWVGLARCGVSPCGVICH